VNAVLRSFHYCVYWMIPSEVKVCLNILMVVVHGWPLMVTLKSLVTCVDIRCCQSQIRGGVIECIYSLSIAMPFYPQHKQCIRWAQFSKSTLNILLFKFLVNFCPPIRASLTIVVTPIHQLHQSFLDLPQKKKKKWYKSSCLTLTA